jgi:hypothetical protein
MLDDVIKALFCAGLSAIKVAKCNKKPCTKFYVSDKNLKYQNRKLRYSLFIE